MRTGRLATSHTAGTTRRRAGRAACISVLALAALAAPAYSQAPRFSAPASVFSPSGGSNAITSTTVPVTVLVPTAITSFSVPLGFQGNPDFTFLSQSGCTVDGTTVVPAGTICSVTVQFQPSGPGLRTGTLLVADASGGTTAFGLSGTGYYPQIAITPAAARIVAGTGPTTASYSGDGGLATVATLNAPHSVAADSFGNIFVADTANNVVRMLDAFGNITTVAGGGTLAGSAADGGPATVAILNNPTWLAVDSAGNLYIADTNNNVIRRVAMSSTRIISTVAGNYTAGFSDGTSATTAQLNQPQGLAVDSAGNLYIADTGNQRIRMVSAASGTITTVAGTGEAGFDSTATPALSAHFSSPTALALDPSSGFLYIADTGNHVIRAYLNNQVTLIVGTTGTAAVLASPVGLAVDPAGDLFIADSTDGIILKLAAYSGFVSTIAGEKKDAGNYTAGVSVATSTRMSTPLGIGFDAFQNLYVADSANNVVRLISTAPGELAFAARALGTSSLPTTVQAANIGNATLTVSNVAAANSTTSSNFTLDNSGATPCAGTLLSGAQCSFNITFAPPASGFAAGEIDIADNVALATLYPNTQPVYLVGGPQPTISIGPPTLPNVVAGQAYSQVVTVSGGYGTVTITTGGSLPTGLNAAITGSTITISGTSSSVGTFTFNVYASDTLGQTAAQSYTITVEPSTLALSFSETVTIADTLSDRIGLVLNFTESVHISDADILLPGLTLSFAEAVHISDDDVVLPSLTLSFSETVTVTDEYQSNLGLIAQTISAPTLSNHAYGDAAFSIGATATSGLPVSITVKGPGTLHNTQLDLTGAGIVSITYSQTGNATYSAATPVVRTIVVSPASATVTAQAAARSFGQPNPAFTAVLSGLVHGDTASSLGGAPTFSTTATLNSVAGTYPISVTAGSLPTASYSYTFVPATLTISGGGSQTITFAAMPNVPYSFVHQLTLSAHSSSSLTVSYTVTGPATVSGKTLTLTGPGLVTVTASQAGNGTFAPAAPVARSFLVTR